MGKMTEEQKAARKKKMIAAENLRMAKMALQTTLEAATIERMTPGPMPTRKYKVGDRVRYGNWDWSAILEVCDAGMYYKLVSCTRNTQRNIPDSSSLKIHYLPWYDFTSYQTLAEIKEAESLVLDDDIRFQYSQRDLSSLINTYLRSHGIDLEPEYQRGNVWTLAQKVNLIDSIFNNIDIGKFAVIKRQWGSWESEGSKPYLYEMLDGKQRLTAIVEYYTGQFLYKGKSYDDLSPFDKHHFKYYSISEAETEPLTKAQKYRYFLKLNTTGTPVDPEHMEKVAMMLDETILQNKLIGILNTKKYRV
jgi:hypothetical protein